MGKGKHKKPKIAKDARPQKATKEAKAPDSDFNKEHPRWSFRCVDWDGPFGWSAISRENAEELVKCLSSYEGMTWTEIMQRQSCGSISQDVLSKDARDRLKRIGRETTPDLFKLQITGRRRVWGVKEATMFRFLWWDPDHQVYPVPKAHT